MKKSNLAGAYLSLISSMLIFGTIGLVRTFIPLSSALIACCRGLIGSAFILVFMLATGRKPDFKSSKKLLAAEIVSGGLIGLNWILLFESFRLTSVPTATLCYYMEPTIVILLAPVFLKEKLTLKKGLCAAVSLVGMVFVSGLLDGDASSVNVPGILSGLGAAAIYSSVVIINKLFPSDDAYTKTFVQLLSAAVVILPYILLTEDFSTVEFSWPVLGLLAVAGIVHTGIAYALYFAGMNGLPGQSVAVLSYIDPVSALILSALFLDQTLSVFGIIGAVLIIGAALVGELKFRKKQ